MTEPIEPSDTVVVRRLIPVPRERVFAAWLDPITLAKFMRPTIDSIATAEADPRIGGQFRIVMHHSGKAVEHTGQYLEIEPPARLSFTWISVNTDSRTTVVTIEFLAHDTGTELILTHRRLPAGQIASHRTGWTRIILQLEVEFASPHGSH